MISFSKISLLEQKFDFELADLGDLSKFTFTELSLILNDFIVVSKYNNDSFLAKFESNYCVLEIIYTSSGKYIRIHNQFWK